MRLDLYLRNAGLLRRRSHAHDACRNGAVLLDGRPARPGQNVRPGQRISIALPTRIIEVEVISLPARPLPRRDRDTCYRLLRDERRDVIESIEEDDGWLAVDEED